MHRHARPFLSKMIIVTEENNELCIALLQNPSLFTRSVLHGGESLSLEKVREEWVRMEWPFLGRTLSISGTEWELSY